MLSPSSVARISRYCRCQKNSLQCSETETFHPSRYAQRPLSNRNRVIRLSPVARAPIQNINRIPFSSIVQHITRRSTATAFSGALPYALCACLSRLSRLYPWRLRSTTYPGLVSAGTSTRKGQTRSTRFTQPSSNPRHLRT